MRNERTVAILRKLADKLILNDCEQMMSDTGDLAVAQSVNLTKDDRCGATGHAVIHFRNGKVEIVGGSFYLDDDKESRCQALTAF